MPLWELHCPQGAFSAEEKRALSGEITKLYTEPVGLPAFYVSVIFHEVPRESFLVGGVPRDDFVRIAVDHIARSFEQVGEQLGLPADTDFGELWRAAVTRAVAPAMQQRGFSWELHTDETPRQYWYIEGQIPPPAYSAGERSWAQAGAPVAHTEDQ